MVAIYPKFDPIIEDTIKKLAKKSKGAELYKVNLERKTSKKKNAPEDYIIKLKSASDLKEYRLNYSFNEGKVTRNTKELMEDSKILRYEHRDSLECEQINVHVDEVNKIIKDKLGPVEILQWTLENKKKGNVWKVKYLDSKDKKQSIRISAIDGKVIN